MDSREDETSELPVVPGQGALDPGSTLGLGLPGALPNQIGGHRIIRELGRGGMGVVYEAEQLSLKRRTMQLIEGEDLDARIARCKRTPPDRERLKEAARLGLQAAEALALRPAHRSARPAGSGPRFLAQPPGQDRQISSSGVPRGLPR